MAARVPAILVVGLVILVQVLFLVYVLSTIGRLNNEKHLALFALGLVVPIAVFGLISEIRLPLILLADMIMVVFFWKLSQKFRNVPANPPGTTQDVPDNVP